jgi:hypothetical protein
MIPDVWLFCSSSFELLTLTEVEAVKQLFDIEFEIWAVPPQNWQGGRNVQEWDFSIGEFTSFSNA